MMHQVRPIPEQSPRFRQLSDKHDNLWRKNGDIESWCLESWIDCRLERDGGRVDCKYIYSQIPTQLIQNLCEHIKQKNFFSAKASIQQFVQTFNITESSMVFCFHQNDSRTSVFIAFNSHNLVVSYKISLL